MPKRSPGSSDDDHVNRQLGERLRTNREMAGRSQTDVGMALGVSFQQIQKYENGTTSISFNRLYDIANYFRVPLAALVAGLDAPEGSGNVLGFAEGEQAAYDAGADVGFRPGPLSKEKVNLLTSFGRIPNGKVRRSLVALVESLTEETGGEASQDP